MAARVVHFDISAEDPERAAKFYTEVFGWQFAKWEGGPMEYWMVTTGPDSEPGINGGLSRREGKPAAGGFTAFLCTIGVDNLDAHVNKVVDAGGKINMPKMPIKGVGWFANATDTEGNTFGLMQPDPAAA